MAGERLGVLGSILIAETVFKALRANPMDDRAGASPLAAGAEETGGDGIPAFSSMSDIVRFVHSRARLDELVVPFARLAPAGRLSRVSV